MKRHSVVFVLVVIAALSQTSLLARINGSRFLAPVASAMIQQLSPPYLREMPKADRVKAEIKGTDTMDTAARQAAAFWQLRQMIYDIALSQGRGRDQVTPDERRFVDGYYADYFYVSQPIEKSLSNEEKPKWFKLRSRYEVDPKFRDELFARFFSANLRAAYFEAIRSMDARGQARRDAEEQAFKGAQEAARQQQASSGQSERAIARCIASGRSELECVTVAMGKGLGELMGIVNPALKHETPIGLRLSGGYAGQGGLSIGFHSPFASIDCKGVRRDDLYTIEIKGSQLTITVQNEPKPYVFAFSQEGRLAGSGMVSITGKARTGTKHFSDGSTSPIYGVRTESCALGMMTLTGPPAPIEVGEVLGGLGSPQKAAPVPTGLRMSGKYRDAAGFNIEFLDRSAVLGCGEVALAQPYAVERQPNQLSVIIQNNPRPVVLALRSDGTLTGSGAIDLNGRVVIGVTGEPANPVAYRPARASCTIGVLRPTPEGPGEATAGAEAARALTTGGDANTPVTTVNAAPAAAIPNSAVTTPRGPANATLSVVSGFPPSPDGANPLARSSFNLLTESVDIVLSRGGFRPSAGLSIIPGLVAACRSGAPTCQQAFNIVVASTVAGSKAQPTGGVTLAAVPAGTYYLFSAVVYNNKILVWNLKVDLKPGANSVSIDAAKALSVD